MLLRLSMVLALVGTLGAEPDTADKQTQLLELVRHTKELHDLQDRISDMIDKMRELKPNMPSEYWDALRAGINIDSYAKWVVSVFDGHLSEPEVQRLNGVFGDHRKKKALDEMLHFLEGKKEQEFVDSVHEFQKTHDRELTTELIDFMQGSASRNYSDALAEIAASRKQMVLGLFADAHDRIMAMRK